MFKLTKVDLKQRDDIIDKIRELSQEIETAINNLNAVMEDHKDIVTGALEKYNDALSQARDFRDGIVSQAEEDMSDKSEKWQESERGQAVEEWKSEWENLNFEDVEIEFPDPCSWDGEDQASDLEQAPEEAGSGA